MSDPSKWGSQTSMPWKEWYLTSGFRGYTNSYLHTDGQLDWSAGALQSDWEDVHNTGMVLGKDRVGGAYDGYHPIYKPVADDFVLDEVNLNEICTVGIHFSLAEYQRVNSTSLRMQISGLNPLLDPNEIIWNKVTGQRYDGVNVWSAFPPLSGTGLFVGVILQGDNAVDDVYFTDLPNEYYAYTYTRDAGGTVLYWFNNHQYRDAIFRNGWNITCGNFYYTVGGWTYKVGEKDLFSVGIQRIKIYYMNGITNSLSRYWMKTAGGVEVDLNGLAFTIPEADLVDYTAGASNWSHITDKIHFIGREGQGTYTLNYAAGFGDFQQTNTRITIPTMPPMNRGTYEIMLEQYDLERGNLNPYTCYCGDWRSRDDGSIYPGSRLIFVVSDEKIPKKPPVPFFRWKWKYKDFITERYAPIDVRATEHIWEGRVGSVSGLRRAIDDKTGLYSGSDAEVDLLQGSDKHFSKLLSQYTCKGQVAEISHGWGEEPEGWHEITFNGVVEDYSLKGPKFHAKLKDLSSLYFNGQLPRSIITNEDFPDAPEDSYGRGISEILGEHSLTTGTNPGAIEAICVDEILFKYIQAGGPLHSTPAVYSDGVVVNPADYTISVEPDGRQYVTFDNDQGDNKITFNCTGYFFGPWNSANGYIQNPGYIISFLWAMLMEIPVNFIDFESVDALADLMDNAGWGESGKVAITALESKEEVLKKILYSFGVNFWQTRDGYFRIGRKDISNLEPAKQLFAQIDLFDHPDLKYNLQELVNSVNVRWNYFPAPEVWIRAREVEDISSIDWFGSTFSPEEPWEFPWNTSGDFIRQRVLEEITKFAYGYRKAEVVVPIDYINELDIFDNVKIQDPFAPSIDGSGESARYYYIIGIDYEWEGQSMRLELVDLHWLLGQYFIFGDEVAMPDLWTDGGSFRYYGYLCDENTWKFSDGFPGKILIDENLLDQE